MSFWPGPTSHDFRPVNSPFDGWDGQPATARALQVQLAGQVSLQDDFPPLRCIAGVDAGFEQGGRITRAAAVLLVLDGLQPLAEVVIRMPTTMPYVPGLLSFRELPALLQALAALPESPDLVMVDGQGIAHPRRLGVAAHLGVVSGLPAIGVAKKILTGRPDELGDAPGSTALLRDAHGQQIGTLLRSKARCRPLVISPGHRISFSSAVAVVQRCLTRYRLPEPTRLADRLASRRNEGTP